MPSKSDTKNDQAERLLKLLEELTDEVAALRKEMGEMRADLASVGERLSGSAVGAGLLGMLGKALRR